MLPCVCSVIDQRGRQNVVRTSVTHGCASCATFLFSPHFDVICDLLLNRRTATWNLVKDCLFAYLLNRSQMTSKCGKNKKVAHEAQLTSAFKSGSLTICSQFADPVVFVIVPLSTTLKPNCEES